MKIDLFNIRVQNGIFQMYEIKSGQNFSPNLILSSGSVWLCLGEITAWSLAMFSKVVSYATHCVLSWQILSLLVFTIYFLLYMSLMLLANESPNLVLFH